MLTRRDFLACAGQGLVLAGLAPMANALDFSSSSPQKAIRCINVVNFIRGVEPRFKTDLLLPVQKQMEIILEHKLPATWLLQFDALVEEQFVSYLRKHKAKDHEIGFWFEMNQKHCEAAGVEWRGRPGYEWDHLPPVAFTIGYTPEERIKLADTAMREFQKVWGFYPKSVASWNLDSITIAHLVEKYQVDAFAVCRDQIATDGFTIWGAPIAGYYPSKVNCWSPATSAKDQIASPIFRMLGQDPVYYYNREYPLPDGRRISEPDTMEPVWTSGRSPRFVKEFLSMIADAPTGAFAYAQLGQENSFPWPQMEPGYAPQMAALAELRSRGAIHVETMAESGRRFKSAFKTTPVQEQILLEDPFGNSPAQGTIWYQSRFYRANLHLDGDFPFLRDLTVYSDRFPQPFLHKATRQNDVEQRMPAIVDGYHWRDPKKSPGAGMFFTVDGQRPRVEGKPQIQESGTKLIVLLKTHMGSITLTFREDAIQIKHSGQGKLGLEFEWDPGKTAFVGATANTLRYRFDDFEYELRIAKGTVSQDGPSIAASNNLIELDTRLDS